MIETKEKPINGLKIKYENVIYDKIIYVSISNWDKKDTINFTNVDSKNIRVSVTCDFKDVEIITK